MKSSNTVWHHATVTRARRESQNGHKGALVWLTGLSGSGKSTLAHAVEEQLHQAGVHTFVLDGDNVRHGLCADLGFSDVARRENIRRVGEASKLFVEAGIVVLTAFISPFAADRERVRKLVGIDDFMEIYCHCPVEVCEARDVKGLYKRARAGEIADFTGISSPYEAPVAPELDLPTSVQTLDESVNAVLALLRARGVIGHLKGTQCK